MRSHHFAPRPESPASAMGRVAKKIRISNYPAVRRAWVFCAQGRIVLFFAAASCVANGTLFAQDREPSFFIGGAFTSNKASASIDAYDGSTPCGVFQNGNGGAPSMFGGMTFPLTGKFSIDTKLEYDNLSTSFDIPATSIVKNTPLAYDLFNNSYDTIQRNRLYDASLGMVGATALVSYAIFPRLHISAGPFVGVLIQHSYNETEQLVSPGNAVYASTESTTRTISSTTISGANLLQGGMEFGASYELPFEPHLALRPSFGATIPFTPITSHLYVYSIGGSISLVYHFAEPPEPVPAIVNNFEKPPVPIETPPLATPAASASVVPKRAMLSVSVKALGVQEDGREVSEPVVSIERTHVTEVYPMLHYVFFEDGSSDIPSRYNLSTAAARASFDEKALFTANALDIHHHVLDILGRRLAENPEASITLVGTRSEHSPQDSALARSVALARARSVQDYLATVWGISRERMRLRERALPEAASDDHNAFGQAENRRVEIIPSSTDITAPLWTEHIERVATPPRIDFEPEITANAGIRTATITVLQHGRILRQIDALTDNAASEYLWTIDERSMPDDAPGTGDSLRYIFTVVDSMGDTASANGVILVKKETRDTTMHASDTSQDKQVERYSLILFDYSSSQLDKKESDLILREMAASIQGQARVTLTGHTDKTGDDAFNDRLARDRVTRAAKMLEAELTQLRKTHAPLAIESRGSRDNLFDNSIPEGRVLSRTVRATIEQEMQ
jgi:outer membrane protein OmpA-like peptidoglycan-associated protein